MAISDLIHTTAPDSPTMSSLELVEFINSQRKEGETELRHDHFMAKVPKVLGEEVAPNFRGYYKASNGKQNPCYHFPKREACLMAMSYSYDLQTKVFGLAAPNFLGTAFYTNGTGAKVKRGAYNFPKREAFFCSEVVKLAKTA